MVSIVRDPHAGPTRKKEWVVGVFFLVGLGRGTSGNRTGGIPTDCGRAGGDPAVVVSCNGFLGVGNFVVRQHGRPEEGLIGGHHGYR